MSFKEMQDVLKLFTCILHEPVKHLSVYSALLCYLLCHTSLGVEHCKDDTLLTEMRNKKTNSDITLDLVSK